ncbi:MAG: DUF493 family protein [Pseudomonadales bacterium]|nr:DUF493 family protein [Pseudomonadales bacterium]
MNKVPSIKSSNDPQPPKIEFPCADYPIKVIGHNTSGFQEYVLGVMEKYDRQLDLQRVTHQDSKNGKFRSVRLFMTAQSEQQLVDLNAEFKASGKVITVL